MYSLSEQDKIIRENCPRIRSIAARKTQSFWFLDADDLTQEGIIGLLDAIKRYKDNGAPLMSFAWKRINGSMNDAKRKALCIKQDNKKHTPAQPEFVEIDFEYKKQEKRGGKGNLHVNLMVFVDFYEGVENPLYSALKKLSPENLYLIEELYFENTEPRTLAERLKIKPEELWWKEQAILKQLRVILKALEAL